MMNRKLKSKGNGKGGVFAQSLNLSPKEEVKSKRVALLESMKYPEKSETLGLDFA